MRHNARRSRNGGRPSSGGNNNNRKNTPSRMKVFDSNGPDVRIRGTAWQVTEKYLALAKDAESANEHILAESYRQHAEHYQRIINSFADEAPVSDARHNNAEDVADDIEDDLGLPESIVGKKETTKEMAVA